MGLFSPQKEGEKMEPLIIIDPGHGGSDRFNRGPTGYVEADGVLDIALKLAALLASSGYRFKLVRSKDETVELYERARIANEWQGNIFVSLHTNAGTETSNGIETFYTLNNEWGDRQHHLEAKRVADCIQRELIKATGLRNRGIKTRLVDNPTSPIHNKDYYAVLRRSKMPAIITEMGFHTNRYEEGLLKTESFKNILAQALFKAITEAYPIEESIRVEKKVIPLNIHNQPSKIEGLFHGNRNYIPISFLRDLGYAVELNKATQNIDINYK